MSAIKPSLFDRTARGVSFSEKAFKAALDLENDHLTELEKKGVKNIRSQKSKTSGPLALTDPDEILSKPGKTRQCTPAAGILRRSCTRKSSLEETLLELYHGNISVGKACEIAEALWGPRITLAAIADSHRIVSRRIQAWLGRKILAPQLYVFLQAIEIRQKVLNETKLTVVVSAIGIGAKGVGQLLALSAATEMNDDLWNGLFSDLQRRGLWGIKLFVGEIHPGARSAAFAYFPRVPYQCCLVHFEKEILRRVPEIRPGIVRHAFEKIWAAQTPEDAREITNELLQRLRLENWTEAATVVEQWASLQFAYLYCPKAHWHRLRDGGAFQRVLREFRETTRIIGPILDTGDLIIMMAAKLRSAERLRWSRQQLIPDSTTSKIATLSSRIDRDTLAALQPIGNF